MIRTQWDKERGIILRECEGSVTFEVMVACTKEGPKQPDFDDYPATIWVFGKASIKSDPETMARQIPFVRDLTQETGDGRKVAWVTRSPFAKALIDEFFHNYAWSSEWNVFDTTEDAISWCDKRQQ